MCGLVLIHTIEKNGFLGYERDGFKNMLVLNSLRGSHSTGVAGIDLKDKKKQVSISKSVGSPFNLFAQSNTDEFFSRMLQSFTTVLGHGRYATMGKVDAYNAHPFKEGHITLVHNGVIRNFTTLKDFKTHSDITVDSHLIAKLFAEEGAENVLPKINGAFVFAWIDSKQKTLNIAKNKERPLFGAKLAKRDTIMMASERETIEWNAARNKMEIEEIYEYEDGIIYTYTHDSIEATATPFEHWKYVHTSYYKSPYYDSTESDLPYSYGGYGASKKYDSPTKNKVTNKIEIEIGGNVDVEFINYSHKDNLTHITGYLEDCPEVEFRAVYETSSENLSMYGCDKFNGEVSSIYKAYTKENGKSYIAYLENVKFTRETDSDDRVSILDVFDTPHSITRYRLKELADRGCAWCEQRISSQELFTPEKLLIEELEQVEALVCCGCAESVANYGQLTKQ